MMMKGTESQIEWAERIRASVQADFERVANTFRQVAEGQQGQDRLDTLAILVILEEKRVEVLAHEEAGYFVKAWQEINGQVRQLLGSDPRFQTIQAQRVARRVRDTSQADAPVPHPQAPRR